MLALQSARAVNSHALSVKLRGFPLATFSYAAHLFLYTGQKTNVQLTLCRKTGQKGPSTQTDRFLYQ